jgi:NAD(P)H-nitrite reductase large subunit
MMDDLVLCHCYDVTARDLKEVVEVGLADIEWIKRHTRAGTGACQGRWCLTLILSWLRENYPDQNWDHLPTARQPLYPIPVWKLAGATPEDDGP